MQNHGIVSQMFEQYTTDVPAISDPDFVSANSTPELSIEELLLAKLNGSDNNAIRLVLEEWIESKKPGMPKEAFDDSRYYFEESGAQGFINSFAVYNTDGKLNLDATSAKIGIPYSFEVRSSLVMGEIVGLKNSMPDEA